MDAAATVHGWFLDQIYEYVNKSQTYTVSSAPAVTGSVLMRRFGLPWGQCGPYKDNVEIVANLLQTKKLIVLQY